MLQSAHSTVTALSSASPILPVMHMEETNTNIGSDSSPLRGRGDVLWLGESPALPWDFREWCEAGQIRAWITLEVNSLDWSNPDLLTHLRQRPTYSPKALLILILYSYLTALFESDEIQRRCDVDPAYGEVSGARFTPGAAEITQFRKENRGLLKWGLVQVIKRAIRSRVGEFPLPAGLKRRIVDAAVARLDLARQMDRGYQGF